MLLFNSVLQMTPAMALHQHQHQLQQLLPLPLQRCQRHRPCFPLPPQRLLLLPLLPLRCLSLWKRQSSHKQSPGFLLLLQHQPCQDSHLQHPLQKTTMRMTTLGTAMTMMMMMMRTVWLHHFRLHLVLVCHLLQSFLG